jgi:circadian clock protein KaiC
MRSIGIDLERWIDSGLLRFQASRPTMYGLEMHLTHVIKLVEEFKPSIVVIDPITSLLSVGTRGETSSMLLRLADFLKGKSITAFMTTLTPSSESTEHSGAAISSLVDSLLLLRDIETGNERNRGLYVLKARGIAHSNQIRELMLTSKGIELRHAYLGDAGVLLTGSAREAQEARDAAAAIEKQQEMIRKHWLLERKRKALQVRIAALQVDLESEAQDAGDLDRRGQRMQVGATKSRVRMEASHVPPEIQLDPANDMAAAHGERR